MFNEMIIKGESLMDKRIITTLIFIMTYLVAPIVTAGLFEDKAELKKRKDVVKLVRNAVARVKAVGRIKAACEFNKANKKTAKDGIYIFAYVCNDGKNDSFVIANGNLNLVYTNVYSIRNHQLFRKALKKNPNGAWIDYSVRNPKTGKDQEKHSYIVELAEEKVCVGSGYYS
jgi:hypothetical protein